MVKKQDETWGVGKEELHKNADEYELGNLGELLNTIGELKIREKELKTELDEVKEKLKPYTAKAKSFLGEMEIEQLRSSKCLFTLKEDISVSMPTGTNWETFVQWAKKEGHWDVHATMSAAAVGALYKSLKEQAELKGELDNFEVPGIKPGTFKKMTITPKGK